MGVITDRLRTLGDSPSTGAPTTVVSLVESGLIRYTTGWASANGSGQVNLNLTELFRDHSRPRQHSGPVPVRRKAP
jgi:hypothetical protein